MSTLVTEAIIRASRGTAAAWTSADPVLESGEWGYETDTAKTKIGDGTTAWTSLKYSTNGDISTKITGTTDQVCKAWVNFNGTGTVAIRDSYNVSSITDEGVGNYTINFTTNMADVNYSLVGTASTDGVGICSVGHDGTTGSASISAITIIVINVASAPSDRATVSVSVFGS